MKSFIYVENLELFSYHGVFEEEKTLGQKFIFDISCEVDYTKAMLSDNLEYSVSYADVVNVVCSVATNSKFNLLEKLSYEIIKEIFNKFSLIKSVELKINKPNAPIDKVFKSCGTKIFITRSEFEDFGS